MRRAVAASALAGALGLTACAGTGATAGREYARGGLDEVPLRSIALVAVSAPPVPLADARLAGVEPYPPPVPDAPLDAGRPFDRDASEALLTAVAEELRARGFEVRTASTGWARGSLDELRATFETDGILIVRAVPLEPVYVLEETAESQLVDPTGDGTGLTLPTGEAVARRTPGRLLLGQAFLFDRSTGARLFSRQLPDVPTDAVIRREIALLDYGALGEELEGLDPESVRARAAGGFARAMLEPFPAPGGGTEAGRARLAEVDVRAERARERFLVRGHLALEVGTGWTFERVEGTARLPDGGPDLPGLDTGAFAPQGALQLVQLRGSWLLPGGLSLEGLLSWGMVPTSYRRRVVIDGPPARLGTQSIEGDDLFGAGMGLGWVFVLEEGLLLHPAALGYYETWGYTLAPAQLFETNGDPDRDRLGLEARVDLRWLPFDALPLMLRVGLHGRFGADLDASSVLVGGGGSVGVGALF